MFFLVEEHLLQHFVLILSSTGFEETVYKKTHTYKSVKFGKKKNETKQNRTKTSKQTKKPSTNKYVRLKSKLWLR